MVELPGRGSTYVTDTPGPSPESPRRAAARAGLHRAADLFPGDRAVDAKVPGGHARPALARTWDRLEEFSLVDCADDVGALIEVLELEEVIVAGYSMGSIVAQRVWRQHRDKIRGLVLCATTDRFQMTLPERAFFTGMGATISGCAPSPGRGRRCTRPARPPEPWTSNPGTSRSGPSPSSVDLAVGGRPGHRRPRPAPLPALAREIDVPTAVVVNRNDHVIPPARQIAVARLIPGATIHDIDTGHAACALETETFVPAFVEAVATVNARRRDFRAREQRDSTA